MSCLLVVAVAASLVTHAHCYLRLSVNKCLSFVLAVDVAASLVA